MNAEELQLLEKWFNGYYASFATSEPADQRNYAIKEFHTHEVRRNIVRMGQDLLLSPDDLLLADAIALFHDVGRFPQYRQYKTFDDSVSVNHAALGAEVLIEGKALGLLNADDRDTIVHAIMLHNVFSLPESLDARTQLFARLIRDADKLDILRVALEYYQQDSGSRADAVALGLPDSPGYSAKVLDNLKRGAMARKADLTTLNDFKLLQLSWLYDLNFTSSLRMVLERGYIDKLAALLPRVGEIQEAAALVRAYVEGRVAGG
jgi:hypothetical protein